jgi:hypothetical protein
MKTITIAQMILRTAGLLVLILGIIFWINPLLPEQNMAIEGVHELLGIIVVLALWVLGLAQGFRKGGSIGLGLATFLLGLAIPIVGIGQLSWKAPAGSPTELINTLHLLLGLAAIGLGEMIGARSKRLAREESVSASA